MAHEGHDHGPDDHHHGEHGHAHEHDHHHSHPHAAQPFSAVACAVITCSDTRSPATDESGALAARLLEGAGHTLAHRALVKDEVAALRAVVQDALASGARAVIVTGGTGLTSRDVTVEALTPLFTRSLDGFGELFRVLSFQQIGAVAYASRAVAGVVDRSLVFALPGSPQAVRLGVERLIAPALSHLVHELSR